MLTVSLSIGIAAALAATIQITTTPAIAVKSDQAIRVSKHVDCERQCPYYYFPICATNGNPAENRMFVNICEMHAWNCDVEKSKQMQKTHYKFKVDHETAKSRLQIRKIISNQKKISAKFQMMWHTHTLLIHVSVIFFLYVFYWYVQNITEHEITNARTLKNLWTMHGSNHTSPNRNQWKRVKQLTNGQQCNTLYQTNWIFTINFDRPHKFTTIQYLYGTINLSNKTHTHIYWWGVKERVCFSDFYFLENRIWEIWEFLG